ncbi:MAG: SDR family NAD(P)-dependent oxidoreductase, partial [Ralstonia sp.]
MPDRRPRSIVITGASAGIGQALARAYAAPGVTLGLVARDAARLQTCAEQCRQAGATVVSGQLDVRDADAVAAWLTAFDDAHPIELLIANAGVASTLSSTSDWEDLARTREVFDSNFYG